MAENYNPKTIDAMTATTYLPYVVMNQEYLSKEYKLDDLKRRVISLHRSLNTATGVLDPETMKESIRHLSYAVNANLYRDLLASQQKLENARARVAALMKLEKDVTFNQSLDIQDEIRGILTGDEYLQAVNDLFINTEKMEKALKDWQTDQNRLRQIRYDNIEEEKKREKVKKPETDPKDEPAADKMSVQDFEKIWNANEEN